MSHFTVALSEDFFRRLFERVRDTVESSSSGSGGGGTFRYHWEVGFKLKGGRVDFQSDNSVRINELDVVYSPLKFKLEVDIPQVCVGGGCIIPAVWPWKGCWLRAPKICIFSATPDITIPLDLGGRIQSEVSGAFRVRTHYHDSPTASTMGYLYARANNRPNQWRFNLDPIWLDLDPIDIADTVTNILEMTVDNIIGNMLGWLPGWAKSLLRWIFGNIADFIRKVLDIADDIEEWLSNLLGVSIGLLNWVATKIADHFAGFYPFLSIDDPHMILDEDKNKGLIPVMVPLRNMNVNITDTEMVLTADVGATL